MFSGGGYREIGKGAWFSYEKNHACMTVSELIEAAAPASLPRIRFLFWSDVPALRR